VNLFLGIASLVVLLTVAGGLVRILRGPDDADRMMAAQLLGTGGAAMMVLAGTAARLPGMLDVALVIALLAAFASIAFVRKGMGDVRDDALDRDPRDGP
jgi:multicomponent Na+:H+ antiporter subunit F